MQLSKSFVDYDEIGRFFLFFSFYAQEIICIILMSFVE